MPPSAVKTTFEPPLTAHEDIEQVVHSAHWDPFSILGPHEVTTGDSKGLVIRAFLPEARQAWVIDLARGGSGERIEMNREHADGFFTRIFAGRNPGMPYRLAVENHEGHAWQFVDPYRFGRVLSDFDIHLLSEGTHYKSYEKLGGHLITHQGYSGVHFAVWAPNALRVSVVGNFNHWDGRRHPMRSLGSSGLWEIFVPDLAQGEVYKFEIKSRHAGYLVTKADPYGFAAEVRPKTASIVWDITRLEWNDEDWMATRAKKQA